MGPAGKFQDCQNGPSGSYLEEGEVGINHSMDGNWCFWAFIVTVQAWAEVLKRVMYSYQLRLVAEGMEASEARSVDVGHTVSDRARQESSFSEASSRLRLCFALKRFRWQRGAFPPVSVWVR